MHTPKTSGRKAWGRAARLLHLFSVMVAFGAPSLTGWVVLADSPSPSAVVAPFPSSAAQEPMVASHVQLQAVQAHAAGRIDEARVRSVLAEHQGHLVACVTPSWGGKESGEVELQLVLSSKGRVVTAMVLRTSLDDETAPACIEEAIRHWSFPSALDGGLVRVRIPLRFAVLPS